jgi:hypothetical protein
MCDALRSTHSTDPSPPKKSAETKYKVLPKVLYKNQKSQDIHSYLDVNFLDVILEVEDQRTVV